MRIDIYRVGEDIRSLYVKTYLLYMTLYFKVNINIFILKYLFEIHIKYLFIIYCYIYNIYKNHSVSALLFKYFLK